MDVGTATIAFATSAFAVAALAQWYSRRPAIAAVVGIIVSQAIFIAIFGMPELSEIAFPLAYSTVPALIGAFGTAIFVKKKDAI